MMEQLITFMPTEGICTSELERGIADRMAESPYTTQSYTDLARELIALVRASPPSTLRCACERAEKARFRVSYPEGPGTPSFRNDVELHCIECGHTWRREFVSEDSVTGAGWEKRSLVRRGPDHALRVVYGGRYSDIDEANLVSESDDSFCW